MFESSMFDDSSSPSPDPDMDANNNNNIPQSWQDFKEEGKRHFRNSNYTQALVSFREALEIIEREEDPNSYVEERQALLSNSVACRLKIGDTEMKIVAIEEAKNCIELNDKWSKAHVRLASAYIALGNHSNDACQALQNAIRCDPTNSTAKQMLTKELRRDQAAGGGSNNDNDNENDYTPPSPSAPPLPDHNDDTDHSNSNNDSYNDIDDSTSPSGANTTNHNHNSNFIQRILDWYHYDASDSWKALVKVMIAIFVLYIAFGGRFGFENSLSNRANNGHCDSSSSASGSGSCKAGRSAGYGNYGSYDTYGSDSKYDGGKAGNYGEGNAYDKFYNKQKHGQRSNTQRKTYSAYSYDDDDGAYGYNQDNHGYGKRYGSSSYDERRKNRRNRSRSSSNLDWDMIAPYAIVCVGIIVLNKAFGVPIHAIPLGFGMRRGFGINRGLGFGGGGLFGPRIRFGGGGFQFGGFGPRFGGGYGGARGRNNHRRAWY